RGVVDPPGTAGNLVGEPVVRGRGDRLVAGYYVVQLPLHRREVGRFTDLLVVPEPDHELGLVRVDDLRVEVAERMPGLDPVREDRLPARVDEDLDPARSLAELDRRPLGVRERRVELDPAERVQRHSDDGSPRLNS